MGCLRHGSGNRIWPNYLYIYFQKGQMGNVICDVIKQNESELANIDFLIEPIIVFNFLCILLF